MKIKYATISECGRRSNNEDAFDVMDYGNRWIGIVCDGLGGHPMGEVASASVVESVARYFAQNEKKDAEKAIKEACEAASKDLDTKADQLNRVNMGTTLVMACIDGNVATITHIGDSRCYVIRWNGELVYQTRDHTKLSFGLEVLDKCFIAYTGNIAIPEIVQIEIEAGDRILLCSDGLYKSIAPEILKARMVDNKSPQVILDTFAFLCEKNGDDNYTGIFAIIE